MNWPKKRGFLVNGAYLVCRIAADAARGPTALESAGERTPSR